MHKGFSFSSPLLSSCRNAFKILFWQKLAVKGLFTQRGFCPVWLMEGCWSSLPRILQRSYEATSRGSDRDQSEPTLVRVVPNFFHFPVIEATVLLGTLRGCISPSWFTPRHSSISGLYRDNCRAPPGSWYTVWTAGPYKSRCVPLWALSGRFNLTHLKDNQCKQDAHGTSVERQGEGLRRILFCQLEIWEAWRKI